MSKTIDLKVVGKKSELVYSTNTTRNTIVKTKIKYNISNNFKTNLK